MSDVFTSPVDFDLVIPAAREARECTCANRKRLQLVASELSAMRKWCKNSLTVAINKGEMSCETVDFFVAEDFQMQALDALVKELEKLGYLVKRSLNDTNENYERLIVSWEERDI